MKPLSAKELTRQQSVVRASTTLCKCDPGPHLHVQEPVCGKCGGLWFTTLKAVFEHAGGHRGDVDADEWLHLRGMRRFVRSPDVTITLDIGLTLLAELEDADSDKIQDTMRSLAAVIRRWNPEAADALESPVRPL